MAKCINLADIDEAVNCQDFDNVAGVMQEVEVGFAEDVANWPKRPAPASGEPMDLKAAGELDGDLVLVEGAKTCKLYFSDETGEFTMTDQGEKGGENVLYQLDLERAKMSSEVLGFLNATRGRKLFLIVTDKNGIRFLMGDKINSAHRIAADAATSGKASSDVNKVPMRFTYVCPRNLVFVGEVVEQGGE